MLHLNHSCRNISSVRGRAAVTGQLRVRQVRPTDSPRPAALSISVKEKVDIKKKLEFLMI